MDHSLSGAIFSDYVKKK